MRHAITALLLGLLSPLFADAGEVIAPASERFRAASTKEVPSFQRHVIPLLGRLGCNGRACHGSFQGQGGFRLSLFGYDFKADHEALTGGSVPRIDRKDPEGSLALLKPTRTISHKGGKRMGVGGWEYNLLLSWARAGAAGTKESDPTFVTLEVEPREILFSKPGDTARLRVVAHWSDGSREDVTPLCRFRSNDESVAKVDAAGRITCADKGDTDVVAFYDNGVATVPVLVPLSDRTGARFPEVPTPTKIDELVVARLRKLGIVPSDLCDDATFLRRVSLDLTGTLPAHDEVASFLADQRPDKRSRKVDELLERPAYAAWWTTRFSDLTGNSDRNGPVGGEQGLNREKSAQWYRWLYRRLKENVSYDRIVEGVVLAVGRRPDQDYEDYCARMSAYFRKKDPADFTARTTMPYFWTRRSVGKPEEKALSFAYAFLGVSLQCAQCHKHPYDQWTKQDFDQFSAFFSGVRYGAAHRATVREMKQAAGLDKLDEDSGTYKRKFVALLGEGKVLPFKELYIPTLKPGKKPRKGRSVSGRVITPKLLGGEEVVNNEYPDPRQPLMDWMRQEDNPFFARALVNRVWAGYFHRGLIDPTDDLNLANPPSNPAVLDHLAHGFIQSGYDLKWLHRQIASSRTYQLSWRPTETNRLDERNFSRAVLRRLPAEVVRDALTLATASDEARKTLGSDPVEKRAIGVASCYSGTRDPGAYALTLFGKPPRAINCDCERSSEPSLLQTVYLRNDQEVLKLLDRPDGWLKQVARDKNADPEKLMREAYLRTLSRLPDEREKGVAMKYLKEAGDRVAGLRDLMWALLNTKEFIVNR
jgi:Protein of unknown function (DUF1549)/Protein of unknown function (DUF1553)